MATKKPLCNYSGSVQEMSSTDIPYSAQVYHGIESAGALSFDNSSHVLTIASGTNTYWHRGVRYTTSIAITCDLDDYVTITANTLYYVYFDDATGTLKASASIWDLKLKCPVATVYWNGSAGAVTRETHGHTRNIDWHINAHLTIGARYYSGLDLTKPTTADDATLTIGAGVIYDEDLAYTIVEQTTCRVFYLASSSKYTFADYSLPYPGTSGSPQYLDTDTYALTAVGANKYACYWVYATGDIGRPIYIVPSAISAPYNTVALARAETPPALTGYGLSPEMKLIYRFIYNGDGNFQESADYRTSSSLPSGYIASTTAAAVSFTPSGNIASTNVQAAIEELDTEKAPITGASLTSSTVNGITLTAQTTGFTAAGGTTSKTLTVEDTSLINQDLTSDASPTFVTAKLTGLTDGYLPKHTSDATGFENSSIYQEGANLVTIGGTDADIGVGSSGSIFSVQNPSANSQIYIGQSLTAHANLVWLYNATEANASLACGTRTSNPFSLKTGNVDRITLDTSGNVKITNLAGSGNRAVYSDANGNLTNSSSDEYLKKNIEDIEYGLDEVLSMRPVKFNWKQPAILGDQNEIGFVAQDIQAIIPEVVGMNHDGFLSLDYPKLVAVLVKAIQELNAKLEAITNG